MKRDDKTLKGSASHARYVCIEWPPCLLWDVRLGEGARWSKAEQAGRRWRCGTTSTERDHVCPGSMEDCRPASQEQQQQHGLAASQSAASYRKHQQHVEMAVTAHTQTRTTHNRRRSWKRPRLFEKKLRFTWRKAPPGSSAAARRLCAGAAS